MGNVCRNECCEVVDFPPKLYAWQHMGLFNVWLLHMHGESDELYKYC